MNRVVVSVSGAMQAGSRFDAVSISSAKTRVIKYLDSIGIHCCHLVPLDFPGSYVACSCCSSASLRVSVTIKMGDY